MNFLVDAQLPRGIAAHLRSAGDDAIHTLDLSNGNRTTDTEIRRIAVESSRVLITKDADFVASHLVSGQPAKLLLISTGNIGNAELADLLGREWQAVQTALRRSNFVELTRSALIEHG